MLNFLVLLFILVFSFSGCSNDSNDIIGTTTEEPDIINDPNGVLLSGGDSLQAISALKQMVPVPVAQDENINGFLSTRLYVVLSNSATVGRVNYVLDSLGVKIIWMDTGFPIISLKTEQLSSEFEANLYADNLKTIDIFLDAWVVYAPKPETLPGSAEAITNMSHLFSMKVPSAWNAKQLAIINNHTVNVLVPDYYYSLTIHPDISGQKINLNDFDGITPEDGNHGYAVSGLIAADYDNDLATGINPVAKEFVKIVSIPIGCLGIFEMMRITRDHFPSDSLFILNTSLGLAPDLEKCPMVQRVHLAAYWKALIVGEFDDAFLHTTAAGNEAGISDFFASTLVASPWTIASSLLDIWSFDYSPDTLSAEDSTTINTIWDGIIAYNPSAVLHLSNILVVGSSDYQGNKSLFSNYPADVRAVGEDVSVLCLQDSPDCDNSISHGGQGTSYSSPLIAGLVSYMWNLDPTLTIQKTKQIIKNAYSNGLVDAYSAILQIDESINNSPVRMTLLDVAGNDSPTPGSNNKFDEYDLALYINQFESYRLQREADLADYGEYFSDYSRYDINGSGFTGDYLDIGNTGKFDLDINYPPQYTTLEPYFNGVEMYFDEELISDLEILCYYAHSAMYTGSEIARDTLLADCIPFNIEAQMALEISANDSTLLTVKVSQGFYDDAPGYENAEIILTPTGGTVSEYQGYTDVEGFFTTFAHIISGEDSIVVEVTALIESSVIGIDTVKAFITSDGLNIFVHCEEGFDPLNPTTDITQCPINFGHSTYIPVYIYDNNNNPLEGIEVEIDIIGGIINSDSVFTTVSNQYIEGYAEFQIQADSTSQSVSIDITARGPNNQIAVKHLDLFYGYGGYYIGGGNNMVEWCESETEPDYWQSEVTPADSVYTTNSDRRLLLYGYDPTNQSFTMILGWSNGWWQNTCETQFRFECQMNGASFTGTVIYSGYCQSNIDTVGIVTGTIENGVIQMNWQRTYGWCSNSEIQFWKFTGRLREYLRPPQ